jgi:3-hydroxyacyl-CoA dehydrogenase
VPSDPPLLVRRVAVLGAGVMGAQIAAHLANAGIPVVLFDLPAKEGDPYGIVRKGIEGLARIDPAPLAAKDLAAHIAPAHYGADLARLADCDLVIEAIAERLDWKRDLYEKVAPHLSRDAILATNTSGLSLAALDDAVPAQRRARFCGIHFFNPPRYMHLVELVPAPSSDPAMLDALEAFLTTTLGKGVIRAKDTPNFIANRIGVFSIAATMAHTARLGLGFDAVDALTGPAIGRAKSATYRTADVVGLDTLAHVIGTMRDTLPTIRGTRTSRCRRSSRRWSRRARSARRREAASTARSARTSWSSTRRRPTTGPARARSIRRWPRSSRSNRRPRNSRSCARRRIRRRNSCGRSSATRSTTRPSTSRRSRTTRATSTSRSAGASGGRWGRSRRGRRRAGARSPTRSTPTSRPGRRSRACRCPRGCAATR